MVLGILYFIQAQFIFFPTYLPDNFTFQYFEQAEEHYFDIDEDTRIHALHFKVEQPKGIILYFHGNTRSLDDWGFAAQEFTKHQWEVFMPDYRTYGKSKGTLTEWGLYQDAFYCYRHLQKSFPEKDIIIYGRSLGTGIATQLATITSPSQLILETPYMSMLHMVKRVLPFVPSMIMRYHFPNHRNIKKVTCPVEIIHGTADTLIPFEQAQQLYKIGKPNTNLTIIENGGHNNLSDFEAWQMRIEVLLNK
jgi:alpha-beta hydrolase superfamily lysophospholipase